jgi:hypothetical protein
MSLTDDIKAFVLGPRPRHCHDEGKRSDRDAL